MGTRIKYTLTGKLILTLIITMVGLVTISTLFILSQDRKVIEQDLEEEGNGLVKSAALGLQSIVEDDIRAGIISEKALFDRNYRLIKNASEPNQK